MHVADRKELLKGPVQNRGTNASFHILLTLKSAIESGSRLLLFVIAPCLSSSISVQNKMEEWWSWRKLLSIRWSELQKIFPKIVHLLDEVTIKSTKNFEEFSSKTGVSLHDNQFGHM